MACSCWAGGGSLAWVPVDVVAAAAEMVEASPAVELTARQRRIIDGRRGSWDKVKDDADDADDIELDSAGALTRSPEACGADGRAGAGALLAREELDDKSEMGAAGCLGGAAAMVGAVVEIAGSPPVCQCHNRQ